MSLRPRSAGTRIPRDYALTDGSLTDFGAPETDHDTTNHAGDDNYMTCRVPYLRVPCRELRKPWHQHGVPTFTSICLSYPVFCFTLHSRILSPIGACSSLALFQLTGLPRSSMSPGRDRPYASRAVPSSTRPRLYSHMDD